MTDITRPGYLYYYDNLPAWTIRVPQPSRFKKVQMTLEFRPFLLPKGGLLACIFRLYDVPDQPFYVHRVFDLSDSDVARYLESSEKGSRWVVEIEGGGEDHGCVRIVSLDNSGFLEGYARCREHNAKLGEHLDGPGSLRSFLDVFEPGAREAGWEGGWQAVNEKYGREAPR